MSDKDIQGAEMNAPDDETVELSKHLKSVRAGHAARLTTVIKLANTELESLQSKPVLETYSDLIRKALESLAESHKQYLQTVVRPEKRDEEFDWFKDRKAATDLVLSAINEILNEDHKSVASHKLGSHHSGSSESHQYLFLRAEQAKLKVKHAKQQAELDYKAAELEAQRSIQMTNQNTEILELEAKILQDMLLKSEHHDNLSSKGDKPLASKKDKTEFVQEWLDDPKYQTPSPTKPKNPDIVMPNSNHSHNPHTTYESLDGWIDDLIPGQETVIAERLSSVSEELTHALIRVESERNLPKVGIIRFSGSALDWPKFVEQFHAQVHTRPGICDTRRMDLLQSHLDGEAKQLVQGLGYSGRNYALALQELKHSFGHHVRVARSYLEKLTSGNILPVNVPSALRRFYISVRDCITTLEQLRYTSDLRSCDIVMKVARRLPPNKVNRWNEFARSILSRREPTLFDLHDWLRNQVDTDFNPFAINTNTRKPKPSENLKFAPHSQSRSTTLFSAVSKSGTIHRDAEHKLSSGKLPCPLCSETHYLYRCPAFTLKPLNERLDVVKSNKLCFNCLKPNHRVEKCFSSVRCQINGCEKNHHTLLHVNPAREVQATSHNIQHPTNTVYFQLVPIVASGPNGRVVKTVALLDSGSDTSLIDTSLAKDLGLKGNKQTLTIRTVNSVKTQLSRQVSLFVKSAHDPNARTVHIKRAWTVNRDAFNCHAQIIDPEWLHINNLQVPDIHPCEVQLLIGLDNPEAHLQDDIIEGEADQPLAVHTTLGWTIMGMADTHVSRHDEIQAHINFTMISNQQLSNQLEVFWKTESFGVAFKEKHPISTEDRKAQVILDETTHLANGHYCVGMLWKNKDVALPNNRTIADRRFKLLLRRLSRDKDLKTLYSNTLNGYIEKNQARILKQDEALKISPRTWYLPHHGVKNPNKPNKVCVVFDAAATYKNTSLNKNLLTGPDLVNNLFGVLQRFRMHPIALSADIEGMYHQVQVPEADSDALRFLWKDDLSDPGPPDTYKMTVHVFGAVDSSSCANYSLRRCARDNANDFDSLTVQTVLRDFYVDDLLTSVETVNQAKKLVNQLTEMLQLGGFHLHKWISSSQELLEIIPDSEKVITTKDIKIADLPLQRALGLKWNIVKDCFTFSPF